MLIFISSANVPASEVQVNEGGEKTIFNIRQIAQLSAVQGFLSQVFCLHLKYRMFEKLAICKKGAIDFSDAINGIGCSTNKVNHTKQANTETNAYGVLG